MKDCKTIFSILAPLVLALAAAWTIGSLFSLAFDLPPAIWIAAALAAEAWAGYHALGRRLRAKAVFGIVFCVSLALSLVFGLVTSVRYLVRYFNGGAVFATGFPWYSGFVFAAITVGPVIVLSGAAWMALHLRERPGNVRDIRLLALLLLTGTAVWAVLWTADRIRRSEYYAYPWHTAFFFALLYFGPWLLLEAIAFVLLKRREKKLPPEDAPPAPSVTIPTPGQRLPWLSLGRIMAVPLLAAAVLTVCLTDTGHPVHNILTVVGNALAVCLALILAAGLVHARGRDPGLVGTAAAVLMALTAAAAVVWGFWYAHTALRGLTGLPVDAVFRFAAGYFGPFLLGGGIFLALLRRVRPAARERSAPGLAVILTVLMLLFQGGLLTRTDYAQDIAATVNGFEASEPDQLRLGIQADVYVDGIFDWEQVQDGDALYLTYSTRWAPFQEIGPFHLYDNIRPGADVTRVYIYQRPGVYALALVRDPLTGEWTAPEETALAPGP